MTLILKPRPVGRDIAAEAMPTATVSLVASARAADSLLDGAVSFLSTIRGCFGDTEEMLSAGRRSLGLPTSQPPHAPPLSIPQSRHAYVRHTATGVDYAPVRPPSRHPELRFASQGGAFTTVKPDSVFTRFDADGNAHQDFNYTMPVGLSVREELYYVAAIAESALDYIPRWD